jgi:hypothetical protein
MAVEMRRCRCGEMIPKGPEAVPAMLVHVFSEAHADGLARLGIVEHDHSARFVDSQGHPVIEDAPGARPYRRAGCPACAAEPSA